MPDDAPVTRAKRATARPYTAAPQPGALGSAVLAVAFDGGAIRLALEAPGARLVAREALVGEALVVQARLLLVHLRLGAGASRLGLGEPRAPLAVLRLRAMLSGDLLPARPQATLGACAPHPGDDRDQQYADHGDGDRQGDDACNAQCEHGFPPCCLEGWSPASRALTRPISRPRDGRARRP